MILISVLLILILLQDRSGEGAESTKFTSGDHVARGDGKSGYGRKGGSSWTEQWLKFDNRCVPLMRDLREREGCIGLFGSGSIGGT